MIHIKLQIRSDTLRTKINNKNISKQIKTTYLRKILQNRVDDTNYWLA